MPLSDHEQRLLDEIEQALYAEDPKFASAVRSAGRRSRLRRAIILSTVGVLAGLGMVLVGLMSNLIALSVIGFVLVVASCGLVVRSLRPAGRTPVAEDAHTGGNGKARAKSAPPRQNGLRSRMEERLRRRFDES
ncbi:MAG TPA: DUF3040 domain-containing protein [Jatrophihabitantaceae bacterium]|nr:DUF3040 domain-containing protein [Jatrophihabitantaceae bacterium]